MKDITIPEAVEIVKSCFDVLPFDERKDGKSFFSVDGNTTTFWLDKRQYFRGDIIQKLTEAFRGINIKGGQCRIEPLTLLWTNVHIEPRKYPQEYD